MRQPGRQSAAALAVVPSDLQWPEPPPHLNDAEALIWNEVVHGKTADWFGSETWLLLEQYCQHGVSARNIVNAIRACEAKIGTDDFDEVAYTRLLYRHQSLSSTLAALATKMRIAQQSTFEKPSVNAKKAKDGTWS